MADTENEFIMGYVDKRRAPKGNDPGGTNNMVQAGSTNGNRPVSVAELRAFLVANNATYFNATRLNAMTKNDMVYATRLLGGDAAGF